MRESLRALLRLGPWNGGARWRSTSRTCTPASGCASGWRSDVKDGPGHGCDRLPRLPRGAAAERAGRPAARPGAARQRSGAVGGARRRVVEGDLEDPSARPHGVRRRRHPAAPGVPGRVGGGAKSTRRCGASTSSAPDACWTRRRPRRPAGVVPSERAGGGVNREPVPLDESADWNQHAYEMPYVIIRREAERRRWPMPARSSP